MKRAGILLLMVALTTTGCVELPTWADAKGQHAADAPPLVPVESPPVTADRVNDDNAPQMLSALRDELDRAADQRTPAPDKKP